MPPLFDAHTHLHDDWLTPHRDRVLADLALAGVRACIVNGTSEQDWPEVTTLCSTSGSQLSTLNSQLRLLPSYGLHPWHVGNASPRWRETLLAHLAADPSAGIGEIGLDRWMLDRAHPDDPRLTGLHRAPLEAQLDAFTSQLRLAAERNLPVTIHCVGAWGALADVLRHTPLPARGFLLHAYGGSAELARDFAARGAYFSFNGYFLGEHQTAKRDLFATLPADRLLVETDAPAMPLPPAHRIHELPHSPEGLPINHPANLPVAYSALARIRDTDLPTLTTQITANFSRLFDFPLNPKSPTQNSKP